MSQAETKKFSLGRIVATPGALEALQNAGQSTGEFLARHVTGDWGDLDDEDSQPQRRRLDRWQPNPVGLPDRRVSVSGSSPRRSNEVGLRYCDDAFSSQRSIEPAPASRLTTDTIETDVRSTTFNLKGTRMTDPTESIRKEMVAEINAEPGSREYLEAKHGQVWDTGQLSDDFDVIGFMAPVVVVIRKSDGQKGQPLLPA